MSGQNARLDQSIHKAKRDQFLMSAGLRYNARKTLSIDTAMKTVAYLRVSTSRQDVQGQRLAILEYARRHSLQIDEFVEATASAVTSPKPPAAR